MHRLAARQPDCLCRLLVPRRRTRAAARSCAERAHVPNPEARIAPLRSPSPGDANWPSNGDQPVSPTRNLQRTQGLSLTFCYLTANPTTVEVLPHEFLRVGNNLRLVPKSALIALRWPLVPSGNSLEGRATPASRGAAIRGSASLSAPSAARSDRPANRPSRALKRDLGTAPPTDLLPRRPSTARASAMQPPAPPWRRVPRPPGCRGGLPVDAAPFDPPAHRCRRTIAATNCPSG